MSGRIITTNSMVGAAGDNSGIIPKTYTPGARRQSPKATPLHKFNEAKAKIKEILDKLTENANVLEKELRVFQPQFDFIALESIAEMDRFIASIATISDKLQRNHMKVVFFGRTSNGKSTVINAMLHSRALPQGIGHTTSCFVQVQASEDNNKYLLLNDSNEKKDVQSIDQFAHALSNQKDNFGDDTMVTLCMPAQDSKLLRHDVVLVDTPGVDVSHEVDKWLDNHCLDADVFVFVANAESTLTQSETAFFLRVKEKVADPNIFVLNNRWDASAGESETAERVKAQHMKQFRKLLCEELGVAKHDELENRVFFVSAKEVLAQRLKDKGVDTPSARVFLADNWQERAFNFQQFETCFEDCISRSAIRTKHAQHADATIKVCDMLLAHIKLLATVAQEELDGAKRDVANSITNLEQMQKGTMLMTVTSQKEISLLSQEVQIKVADDFHSEIRKLALIIDSFDKYEFDDGDRASIRKYKEALIKYLDTAVTDRLAKRCTQGLAISVKNVEKGMMDGFAAYFPPDELDKVRKRLQHREPFGLLINVNVQHMTETFREDLNFHFSLSLHNLLRWVTRVYTQLTTENRTRSHDNGDVPGNSTRTIEDEKDEEAAANIAANTLMASVAYGGASAVMNGGMGMLLLGTVLYRAVGVKPIIYVSVGVGGLYAYEYLRWNSHAKERQLKKQLRQHVELKMRESLYATTAACDQQVKHEMHAVLANLRAAATELQTELKKKVEETGNREKQLESLVDRLSTHKGNAVYSKSEIERFEDDFLEPNDDNNSP